MANKKITDVDIAAVISDMDYFFINQNNSIKQIKRTNMPKPTPKEIGAISSSDIATLIEVKAYLGI